MRADERRVLEALADGRWASSLDLGLRLGLGAHFTRGLLYNLAHVGWVRRGGFNDHNGRLWHITATGKEQLAPAPKRKPVHVGARYRRDRTDQPAPAQAKPKRKPKRKPKTGGHAITLDEWKAREARKAGS